MNVQNIPSKEKYRKAFVGNLINSDFSSQESRVLAHVSKDQAMLDFFNIGDPLFGDDIHSFVATKMFRIKRNDPNLVIQKKTHPEERSIAKSINFKISYGGSAFTLKDDFGVEEEVAQEFIDGFFLAFPTLKVDFDKAKKEAVKNGYIEMDPITKRRWFDPNFQYMNNLEREIWKYFPEHYRELPKSERDEIKKEVYEKNPQVKDMWSEYFTLKSKLERNALNYRIQGTAGSQTKTAGILIRRWIIRNDLQEKVKLVNLIHDETLTESFVDLKLTQQYAKQIEHFMEQAGNIFCSTVNMKAEAIVSSYWHH